MFQRIRTWLCKFHGKHEELYSGDGWNNLTVHCVYCGFRSKGFRHGK